MLLNRRTIDNKIEEKILTGLITNTKYAKDIAKLINKETFVTSYAIMISKWCLEYLKKYGQAPEKHIQDIFEIEKTDIKEEERNIISAFLSKLSSSYEQESEFNVEYLKDQTIQYVKKQSQKVLADRIQHLSELGRVEDVDKEISKYRQIAKETSGAFDPFTDDEVKQYFTNQLDKSNVLFTLPGALGRLLGPIERHWLVGILAPTNRGKSFWLQEFAVQALMERKKVLYVSLEMDKDRVKRRIYKRMTGYADKSGDFIYPCFDCYRNQNDTCRKKDRTCQVKITDDKGLKPKAFVRSLNYVPCTVCRGKKDFMAATWYSVIKREEIKQANTLKIIKGVRQAIGSRLRVKAFPRFTANVHDIMSVLNDLETNENFIPDVIIIDYADILYPEDSKITGRDRIDETWKWMGRLADEYHCTVISASQSNRGSFKKKYVDETDVAEDIRKISNSDMFIALNQTKQEKREGIMRINSLKERDGGFDSHVSCTCLQQLSVGQPFLDSELIVGREDEEEPLTDEV